MIEDEFKELMTFFSQSMQGKQVNLEEVCKHSLEFFDKLKEKLKNGSAEDKKEALNLMNEMYTKLLGETKAICEKTGMTEEQLLAFAENPSNFSPDQWRSIQNAKQKMAHKGEELSKLVKGAVEGAPAPQGGNKAPSGPSERKKMPHRHKDKWMKS